ncbi:MAG: hypothetical protein CBC13_12120 [Planctomycetia bacterium TMED53]|nr:MAG: hypothetical protein CBC13_12120 [Planctomycetia bacterium TMED53]
MFPLPPVQPTMVKSSIGSGIRVRRKEPRIGSIGASSRIWLEFNSKNKADSDPKDQEITGFRGVDTKKRPPIS